MNLADTIAALILREGGYSNDPHDSGGETMYGVTVAVARAYGYEGPMNMMPRGVAVDIYTRRYWAEIGLDKLLPLSGRVAEECLDTAVNMGTSWPGKFLQRALNALNKGASLYPDMTVDGRIGPMTVDALRRFLTARGTDGETVMLRMLNAQQGVRYLEIAEAAPKNEDFEFGWWLNRVA